jgi:thymidine phosphorylase
MKTEADSRRLAESLVSLGNASGVTTEAIITRMDAPLGRAVGNALEVIECIEVLKGDGPADVGDLSVELAARMLVLARVADDRADGERRIRAAIASGAGLERFRRIIEQQGGDPHVVDDYGRLPTAPERHLVEAPREGFLTWLDAELVGRASVALGAGRDRIGQPVDAAVGIMVLRKPGEELRAGDPVLDLYYRDRSRLEDAMELVHQAIQIGDQRPVSLPLMAGMVR